MIVFIIVQRTSTIFGFCSAVHLSSNRDGVTTVR